MICHRCRARNRFTTPGGGCLDFHRFRGLIFCSPFGLLRKYMYISRICDRSSEKKSTSPRIFFFVLFRAKKSLTAKPKSDPRPIFRPEPAPRARRLRQGQLGGDLWPLPGMHEPIPDQQAGRRGKYSWVKKKNKKIFYFRRRKQDFFSAPCFTCIHF